MKHVWRYLLAKIDFIRLHGTQIRLIEDGEWFITAYKRDYPKPQLDRMLSVWAKHMPAELITTDTGAEVRSDKAKIIIRGTYT